MILYYILGAVTILVLLYFLFNHCFRWYENFQPLEKTEIHGHKKEHSNLIIQYGNINLDVTHLAENVKTYARANQWDYHNAPDSPDSTIWKTVHSFFEQYAYEYICIVPSKAYVHNKARKLQTLLEQAGDSSMIVSRSEIDLKSINIDLVIFRACEWTKYKLHQFFYKQEGEKTSVRLPTEVILDQVYTPYVHKTFVEFQEHLDMGIPYMLTNICVYHQHALLSAQSELFRYHDREVSKKDPTVVVYPWTTIKHPRFVSLSVRTEIWKSIDASVKETKIPKIIFQTMETHLTTVNVRSCMEQVQSLNPKYKYYYFNSYECRKFIQLYYPDVLGAYDTLLPGAYKADLWRYCVLHKYGGFYMDARMYPYLSFDAIITKETEFMSCIDCTPNMLYQAILAVKPQSSYMQYAIDECVENIRKRRLRIGDLAITGPRVMGRALNKCLERPVEKDLTDIQDPRIVLLLWNSIKAPKYLMSGEDIFACHKYTKLLTDKEVTEETTQWLMLTGKEHYSSSFRHNRIYKDKLFEE